MTAKTMVTQSAMQANIAANLAAVKAEISAAAATAGRPDDAVTLVAIAKTHPGETVRKALAAGHRVFGENRVQEAEAKWPVLREAFPVLRLHLVGPLQTNKVAKALAMFDVIESVDRPKLAHTLAGSMDRTGHRPGVLVQVNTGEEPQKHGVLPGDADSFVRECIDVLELPVLGLMCVPPVDEEPALHFALLRDIAARNGLAELSMGMTADFPVAVQFGATLVRVGTAIFGERPPPPA